MDEVFCLPIISKKKEKWHVIPNPLFGQGQYGSVYGACKRSECAYVMKIIKFGKKTTPTMFDKEVEIQTEVAVSGLTIPVEDSWRCKTPLPVGVIIMRSLDITVKDFLIQPITIEDADAVLSGVRDVMKKLWMLGYYHGDNHFANMMMKRINGRDQENVVKTSLGNYQLFLIDFGKAGRLADPGVYPGGRPATKERRLKEDRVILDTETKQVLARFHPDTLESMII